MRRQHVMLDRTGLVPTVRGGGALLPTKLSMWRRVAAIVPLNNSGAHIPHLLTITITSEKIPHLTAIRARVHDPVLQS
jgi:hypothetical protein